MSKPPKCAWEGCDKDGEFPAPVSPHDLNSRQYFCSEHIREFNKSWNGLEGFDEDALTKLQNRDGTWGRPTWKLGNNPSDLRHAGLNFDNVEDLYSFFQQQETERRQAQTTPALPPEIQEACAVMGLNAPLGADDLKVHYHKLVKQHHPDKHGGAKEAEDHLKRINSAYQVLQKHIE